MILLTVGTQLPFDRLVEHVDRLAPELHEPIVAQIGASKCSCRNIEAKQNYEPAEFSELIKSCTKIISHAGIGTILNARKFGKPIIIIPRLAKFGEHRNDHQIATCNSLSGNVGIHTVLELGQLTAELINTYTATEISDAPHQNQLNLIRFIKNELVGRDT